MPAQTFSDALRNAPRGPVCVGFSGGLDSTVLLHALAFEAGVREQGLRALHVHHGLHRDADAWAAHCRSACDALGVPLAVVAVVGERHDLVVAQSLRVSGVPGGARCRFRAGAVGPHLDPHHVQRHPEPCARRQAMRGPRIGIRMQSVVHVQCAKPAVARGGIGGQRVQQHRRIEPAAEADPGRGARCVAQRVGKDLRRGHGAAQAAGAAS